MTKKTAGAKLNIEFKNKLGDFKMHTDIQILKKRIIELFCTCKDNEIDTFLETYTEDGCFSDLDYTVNYRANWPASFHLGRLSAFAFARKERKELDELIVKGMEFWFKHDFHNPNWFYEDLEIPWRMGLIALTCEDILPKDIKEKMISRLLTDLNDAMKSDKLWTGMNLLLFGRNAAMHGILANNSDIIIKGRNYMENTIFISDVGEEGIYFDGSFAQHDVLLYNHSYGCMFFNAAVSWLYILGKTDFAFQDEKLQILTDLFLKGTVKMGRFDAMDYNPLGRARVMCFTDSSQQGKYYQNMGIYLDSIELLKKIHTDKNTIEKLESAKDFILGKRNTPYEECNAQYWQIKFMTHHRNNFYASARLADKEVHGGDLCRKKLVIGQDNLGGFGAYGSCVYMCDGKEYEKIFPVWDWGLIPGTTTPHIELTLEEGALHDTEFAGNVSDGMYGLCAADMKKSYVHTGIPMPDADGRVLPVPEDAIPEKPSSAFFGGKKAYFFMDEGIFHLGCDLYTDAEDDFNTTFEQSILRSEIYADGKKIADTGNWQDINAKYIWHDNKVYVNIDEAPLKLKAGDVKGNYNRIFITPTAPQEPVYNRTFTLIRPQNKNHSSYAYAVLPGIEADKAESAFINIKAEILSNNEKCQAIYYKDKVMAVFYDSTSLVSEKCNITVDKPCFMIVNCNSKIMHISTPDRSIDSISVELNGKSYTAKMPEKMIMKGSSVEIKL